MRISTTTRLRTMHGHALMALLVIGTWAPGVPSQAMATIYRCLDAEGKTVLSNKQSGLHRCEVLVEGSAPSSATPEPGSTHQPAAPAVTPERPFVPLDPEPLPPHQPPDARNFAGSDGAPPHPREPPASSHQPCPPGLNPLNPLSRPPCVRPDESERQPSESAPIPPE